MPHTSHDCVVSPLGEEAVGAGVVRVGLGVGDDLAVSVGDEEGVA